MLNFEVDVNLLYGFYVGSALERDLGAGTTLSNRYWLGYNSQCWGARLVVDFEDDETTVMVGFTLLGLGKISDVDLISY
jgi:hypothetical protein